MNSARTTLAGCFLIVSISGCSAARTWTPPPGASIPPPPQIMVRTPQGLLPEDEATTPSAEQRKKKRHAAEHSKEMSSQADVYDINGSRWSHGEGLPDSVRLIRSRPVGFSRPSIDATDTGPIYPQYYYVRGEHTPTGYVEGRYGRIDNFTPGEHTSTGYIPGHYRGDGNYTRPEHTSTGYIRGHYRAEPQPGNAASRIGASTPAGSPGSFRPYGR